LKNRIKGKIEVIYDINDHTLWITFQKIPKGAGLPFKEGDVMETPDVKKDDFDAWIISERFKKMSEFFDITVLYKES
jgi:hypothetical protein